MPSSAQPKKRYERPGRPKDPSKREKVLDAAKRLFPEFGYDGVSMDTIATEAGVSKLTLYSHFADKDDLFLAAVEAICREQLSPDLFDLSTAQDGVRDVLVRAGRRFLDLVSREQSIRTYRMLAGRSPESAHLSDLFFDLGPRLTIRPIEAFLRQANETGLLSIPEPERAAEHFSSLLKGFWHTRRIIGCSDRPTPEQMEAHLLSAVDLFIRAHQPPGRTSQ